MEVPESVLDPSKPWDLPRLNWEFAKYPYRKTPKEWEALLARAEQGDAEAECDVAAMYDDGCKTKSGKILVKRSVRKALEWYRRSTLHGNAIAQNNLAIALISENATKRERSEGLIWLKKAARARDFCAMANLAAVYRDRGDLPRAVHWFRKLTTSGDDAACIQLAVHNYWGLGVRADPSAAVGYLRKAIKGKNLSEADRDDAFFYLGIAYLEGKGVRSSIRIAQNSFNEQTKRAIIQLLNDC